MAQRRTLRNVAARRADDEPQLHLVVDLGTSDGHLEKQEIVELKISIFMTTLVGFRLKFVSRFESIAQTMWPFFFLQKLILYFLS